MAQRAALETFGPERVDHFDQLREDLTQAEQHAAVSDLHEAVRELGGEARW